MDMMPLITEWAADAPWILLAFYFVRLGERQMAATNKQLDQCQEQLAIERKNNASE